MLHSNFSIFIFKFPFLYFCSIYSFYIVSFHVDSIHFVFHHVSSYFSFSILLYHRSFSLLMRNFCINNTHYSIQRFFTHFPLYWLFISSYTIYDCSNVLWFQIYACGSMFLFENTCLCASVCGCARLFYHHTCLGHPFYICLASVESLFRMFKYVPQVHALQYVRYKS